MKTVCYIDGFNLYHAIAALKEPLLKWLNLHSLALSYLNRGDTLESVVFFTALCTWDASKRQRHLNYVKALEANNVEVVLSVFDKVNKHCDTFDRWCKIREEKRTDVAIATRVMGDCYDRGIERVVLITADSDQIPMVQAVKTRFPSVVVFLVAPPNRLDVARQLSEACDGITELRAGRIRQHRLPDTIRDADGAFVAACPALYGPTR